ncbi:hypothetical protein chiPu_0011017 [Chiloscyllium punctatum]|uniref:Uncharacterized protein n=1 Tax=Chiloscyllium punctatum TaxID=137246 RepID=A0A401SQ71_CHIPU|nr:hypothetical protein [Chiloscyllium punctatum]
MGKSHRIMRINKEGFGQEEKKIAPPGTPCSPASRFASSPPLGECRLGCPARGCPAHGKVERGNPGSPAPQRRHRARTPPRVCQRAPAPAHTHSLSAAGRRLRLGSGGSSETLQDNPGPTDRPPARRSWHRRVLVPAYKKLVPPGPSAHMQQLVLLGPSACLQRLIPSGPNAHLQEAGTAGS